MGAAAVVGPQVVDCELMIRRVWYGRYAADLRVQMPGSDADTHLAASLDPLDFRELENLRSDPKQYGLFVGEWLMRDSAREMFDRVDALAQQADSSLRLRITFDDNAAELHRIHWEMARYPTNERLIFVGENMLFSRYIQTSDFRRVHRRSKGQLRALLAIASPNVEGIQGANARPLARVDTAAEQQRAREALNGITTADLATDQKRVSLESITEALRARGSDILYLVCHGALVDRQPHLWLETPDGAIDDVAAEEFVARIVELRHRPSLIVLASCQSAGGAAGPDDPSIGDDGVLAALGPRLAAVGIPAVLAMQGNVTIGTIKTFMPKFFSELAQHGQLDLSASIARGTVRARADAWAPVLFTRLKGGGIWYRLGWDDGEGPQLMPGLKRAIDDARCTPIIGPGVLDNLHGTRREIASDLAARRTFPLSPQDRDDLPQVAQFQSVENTRDTLVADYLKTLCDRIQSRYRDALPQPLQQPLLPNASTDAIKERCLALLGAAWTYRQKLEVDEGEVPEPHNQIAQLPFAVFISTNADSLLETALNRTTIVQKDPETGIEQSVIKEAFSEVFRWSPDQAKRPSVFDTDKNAEFSPAKPLVYHLFGELNLPDSLVLTQDDYFDALIAASSHERLPQAVKEAFTNKTLLFLGFNIDDWHFRVLFRFIVNLPGVSLLGRHKHVAVQIDPEEQRFSDPRAARKYLSKYFLEKRIHIYWGTVDDFVRDLKRAYEAPDLVGANP